MPKETARTEIEEDDSLILSVRLASGRFESSIQVPLFATDAEKEAFVDAWMKLMEAGVRCGREHRAKKSHVEKESTR